MPCYQPIEAFQDLESKLVYFKETPNTRPLTLPCGRCIGCRVAKAKEWAIRCSHEAQMHKENAFLTLTLSDENMPDDGALDKRHLQLFFKRLRKNTGRNIRYYACGEYGGITGRAHYHVLLFGMDFHEDRKLWKQKPNGDRLYTSAFLEKIWGLGHAIIGNLTFGTAAYCARYTMKKKFGEYGGRHVNVDPETGELTPVQEPFAVMSLRPAIGLTWLEKYHADIYAERKGYVRLENKEYPIPRYYDKIYGEMNPDRMEYHKHQRYLNNEAMTNHEIRAHELITRARTRKKEQI
jgi:hypothetical protein